MMSSIGSSALFPSFIAWAHSCNTHLTAMGQDVESENSLKICSFFLSSAHSVFSCLLPVEWLGRIQNPRSPLNDEKTHRGLIGPRSTDLVGDRHIGFIAWLDLKHGNTGTSVKAELAYTFTKTGFNWSDCSYLHQKLGIWTPVVFWEANCWNNPLPLNAFPSTRHEREHKQWQLVLFKKGLMAHHVSSEISLNRI